MQDILGKSLKNMKWIRTQRKRLSAILLVLSLIVTLNVFWVLRQPGLTLAGDASCGILDHSHGEECFTQVLVCELPEETHSHTETCYTTRFTEQQERLNLVCTQAEDPHEHGDACYTTHLTQAQETLQLICEQSTEPHSHTDDCYEIQYTQAQETLELICTEADELHEHTDNCYQLQHIEAEEIRQLVCTLPEEPHTHADSCYDLVITDPAEETVLTCQLQTVPHEHTEDCYIPEVIEACEEQVLTCNLSETAHIHEDACYIRECHCTLQEHIHSIDCYSDETADTETLLDWQDMFAAYPYTGSLRQDLVGIAKTQVGYRESTRNFEIGSDGIRRGYTRYGAWYGTPYREWSAAFVSFCLNYADADPEQTPGNIGANAMAEHWNKLGRFAPAGEYIPVAGDLVFFGDNTVGIVSEVQAATFYVIRADIDDAVVTSAMPLTDNSITGWGITEESPTQEPAVESEPPPASEIPSDNLLDISRGPVFFIFEKSKTESEQQRFLLKSPRAAVDLLPYLQSNKGTYSFVLLDTNNHELPKDEAGNYIASAGTSYKLYMPISSPNGFLPGTYQYQLPQGLSVVGGTGSFILEDGTNVGTWTVTDTGLITMEFNSNANHHADTTITAAMGITFLVQDSPLNFDGKITVTIEPPPQQETTTKLNKWANQGAEGAEQNKTDPTKLYWTMEITGKQNSQIPGSVITDQIKTGDHRYTQSDMAAGIKFGASDPNGEWHSWTVYPGNPNLTWTETGWTYTIPETITCWCGQVTLGNNNWTYYADYTSTPTPSNITGSFWYTNEVTIDGQYAEGWGKFTHSGTEAGIVKTGDFHGDANGGVFLWEFQATIPGRKPDSRAAYYTQIVDQLYVKDLDNATVAYIKNDADKATVTAVYQGQTITVPHVSEATPEDEFAWVVGWSEENNGVAYTRSLLPLCRCHCTETSCHYWNATHNRCDAYHYLDTGWSGFCFCWTPEEAITFTFSYTTNDPTVIEAYGGQSNNMLNQVSLQQTVYKPDGSHGAIILGEAHAKVPIPGVFKKELTQDFNGYTAHYKITVNEAKLVLTNGSSLTIHDVMTDTLAYISGSLVITSEDESGNTTILRQGIDYTVTYDGTGNQTDAQGKPVHVMDIVILHPQPVMYILDYDTTLLIPQGTTEGVKYSNSANITLWGEVISDSSTETVYANINISAKRYDVQMFKTCAVTGNPLADATFGLFNDHGGLITSDATDENGELLFQTNITEGIILREHVLYYMQELQAPPGYQLDDTKYWFCFCSKKDASCSECATITADVNAVRIPFEQIGKLHATNQLMHYDLPATGGPGIFPLILVSVMFIMTPLVYASIQRRKRERRGIR